jgi:hypothetical protein
MIPTLHGRSKIKDNLWIILSSAILFCVIIIPPFIRGLYGIDWTDTTFHYQEAINIINGRFPFKDFLSPVLGLSFYIEAYLFKLGSPTYLFHRGLGLLILYVISFSAILLSLVMGLKKWQTIVISLGIALFYAGNQVAFSYTFLSLGISLLVVPLYLKAMRKNKNYLLLFIVGLMVGSLILIKQSIGIAFFLTTLIDLLLRVQRKKFTLDKSVIYLFFVLFTILIYVVVFIGVENRGVAISLISESSELKDLSSDYLKTALSLFGIGGIRDFVKFIIIGITVFCILYWDNSVLRKAKSLLLLGTILSPIALWSFSFAEIAITQYTYYLYTIIGFSAILQIIYNTIITKDNIESYYLSSLLLLACVIMAHQLSWPGLGYISLPHAYMLAIISCKYFGAETNYNSKALQTAAWVTAIFVVLYVSFNTPVQNRRVIPYKQSQYSAVNWPYFDDWQVSNNDIQAIDELREIIRENSATTLFQLPWSPILYTVLGLSNATKYDLPYHDTMTMIQAKDAISEIFIHPPDLLLLEPAYRKYDGPFQAKGMKYVYSTLDSLVIPRGYHFEKIVTTDFKSWEVYTKNR